MKSRPLMAMDNDTREQNYFRQNGVNRLTPRQRRRIIHHHLRALKPLRRFRLR